GVPIYRLDVGGAFAGLVARLRSVEDTLARRTGRKAWGGAMLASGGLLAQAGDIVVDDVHDPRSVYGIANGRGDFVRHPHPVQSRRLRECKLRFEQERAPARAHAGIEPY